jgi:hypothetical protein
MLGFLLGAIAGGVAGYYWRENIHDYVYSRALDRAGERIDNTAGTGQERLRALSSPATSEARGSAFDADFEPSREVRPPDAGEHR